MIVSEKVVYPQKEVFSKEELRPLYCGLVDYLSYLTVLSKSTELSEKEKHNAKTASMTMGTYLLHHKEFFLQFAESEGVREELVSIIEVIEKQAKLNKFKLTINI